MCFQVNGFVVAFGGVDREQNHYNDAIIYDTRTERWSRPDQRGSAYS